MCVCVGTEEDGKGGGCKNVNSFKTRRVRNMIEREAMIRNIVGM